MTQILSMMKNKNKKQTKKNLSIKMKNLKNYKTNDIDIISAITLGEVIPEEVQVKNIDTSVQNLFTENPYASQPTNYSGDVLDYSYTSLQDIKRDHRVITDQVNEKKQSWDDLNAHL